MMYLYVCSHPERDSLTGRMLTCPACMCAEVGDLRLVPQPARVYPTNYCDGYSAEALIADTARRKMRPLTEHEMQSVRNYLRDNP
jgi:hypothetical protein